jgi:hypothetical protein
VTIDPALPLLVALSLQVPSEGTPAAADPPPVESRPTGERGAPAGYCPPPCAAVVEKEPGPWTGSAALGFALSAGNTESLTVTWNLLLDYRTSAWEWTLEAEGLVARADVPAEGGGDAREVAHAYSLDTRLEKRFTPLLGAYALVGGLVDHPAAIELRLDGELGAAFTALEREGNEVQDWLLRIDLGLHYSNESRREYYAGERDLEDVDLLSPGIGLTFKCPVGERAKFYQFAQVLPDVFDSSRVRFASKSTLATFLTERLALNAHLEVDFDSDRAAGKKDTDVVLTFGAEYDF